MAAVGEIVEELVADLEKEKLHDDGGPSHCVSDPSDLQTRYRPLPHCYGHTTSSLFTSRIPSTPKPPIREHWTFCPKH